MEQYSNKGLVVPFYTQEEIERGESLVFPFNDEYMVYDKKIHEYLPTEQALIEYGIDYGSMQPDELRSFLRSIARAVYSYIKIKAGTLNYPKMMYRIAKGLGAPNLSPLDCRTIFLEEVLLVQAKHMAEAGYAKDMPKTIMSETGRMKANDLSETDGYWLHDDVITTLKALNLTNPQRIRDSYGINWDEY